MDIESFGISLALMGIAFDLILSGIQFGSQGSNTLGVVAFLGSMLFMAAALIPVLSETAEKLIS